ncbi:hypothetical protein PHLCEN_2v7613 [Hermanssonia centrifuga]|uniref:Uncharacterized protein n=1 Tax=Hermanssonia centrifuga TaxID=98765 RepID=A0A2R6NW22_9APHY|nr:hypothetical protein PHLCEN_2v7613 [Hermanssonia centrifuga]
MGQREVVDTIARPPLTNGNKDDATRVHREESISEIEVTTGLRASLKAAHDDIMKARRENKRLVAEKEELQDNNGKLRVKCRDLEVVIDRGRETRQLEESWERKCHDYGQQLEEARGVIASLKRELESVQSQQRDKDALLEIRTTELRDAQTLLDRTDVVSHAAAIRMVENLNSEIYQLAALIPDSVKFLKARRTETELARAAYRGAETSIGKELVGLLASLHHSDDPICVQIALQTLLTQSATHIITSWDVRLSDRENSLLERIHSEILLNEPAIISAKWRSLTRRYLRQMSPELDVTPSIGANILSQITDILLTSGVYGEAQNIHRNVLQVFGAKVKDIVSQSGRVGKAISEDITSTHFQVIAPYSGDLFSSKSMEDEYGEGRGNQREQLKDSEMRTLCATQVGLMRCDMRKKDGKVDTIVLLKSKIALESLKQEMMRAEQDNLGSSST